MQASNSCCWDTYSQLWRLLREYIASGEEVSGVRKPRSNYF